MVLFFFFVMEMPSESNIQKTYGPVKSELKQVQSLINKQLRLKEVAVAGLVKPLRGFRGRMIRPALLLLSGRCCGPITEKHIRAAAVLEMLHNATLLHDDVIDEGLVRRGMPTANKLYGNESAILLGDFLLSRIFMLCNDFEPEINKIITSTTARLCEGELSQIAQRHNWGLVEKEYIGIITDKTACLFSSCCNIGALLCGADKEKSRRFAEFGLNFGIAFQIADDLIDLAGDEKGSGKTTGRDIDKHKPTLALIHLLKQLTRQHKAKMIRQLDNGNIDMKAVRKDLNFYGSIRYAKSRISDYIDKSIFSLGGLDETDAGEALIEIARSI
jgi:octaprenyl-diphosphate synthase